MVGICPVCQESHLCRRSSNISENDDCFDLYSDEDFWEMVVHYNLAGKVCDGSDQTPQSLV